MTIAGCGQRDTLALILTLQLMSKVRIPGMKEIIFHWQWHAVSLLTDFVVTVRLDKPCPRQPGCPFGHGFETLRKALHQHRLRIARRNTLLNGWRRHLARVRQARMRLGGGGQFLLPHNNGSNTFSHW